MSGNGTERGRSPDVVYDLYCGLGGWAEGFLTEGYRVIGFDIEQRPYPGQLVLQDVCTIHGAQLKDATVIVSSSPCQEFSYRAMPWKRAKAQTPDELGLGTPAWWEKPEGKMSVGELDEWKAWRQCWPVLPPVLGINLFYQSIRIRHEAEQASGRHIPLVMENVKGAQQWIGSATWHFGSFYLWGDVPALMPFRNGGGQKAALKKWFGREGGTGVKNHGGSWFAIGSPGQTNVGQNPDGRKIPGQDWSRYAKTGEVSPHWNDQAIDDGTKQGGNWWHDPQSLTRRFSSRSAARKQASAEIAKIPFPLAQHIARVYKTHGDRPEHLEAQTSGGVAK